MENTKKLRVFHAQDWTEYSNWIDNKEIVDDLKDADLILFEGGADVSPKYYDQPPHKTTSTDPGRDLQEKKMYDTALKLSIPMLGICRGAQFITAMQPKGMLVQHQPNVSNHKMITFEENEISVTSSHHQAMYPFNMDKKDYKILGWTENMLAFHKGGNDEELAPEKECEMIFYPKVKALCIQSHPEWMAFDSPSNIWFRKIFDQFINNKL